MKSRLILPVVSATAISLLTVPGAAWAAERTQENTIILAQAEQEAEGEKGMLDTIKDAAEKARKEAAEAAGSVKDAVTGDDEEKAGTDAEAQTEAEAESETRAEAGQKGSGEKAGADAKAETEAEAGAENGADGKAENTEDATAEDGRRREGNRNRREETRERRGQDDRRDGGQARDGDRRGSDGEQARDGRRQPQQENQTETDAEAEAEANARAEAEEKANDTLSEEEERLAKEREQRRRERLERQRTQQDGQDRQARGDDDRDGDRDGRRGERDDGPAVQVEIRSLQPVQKEQVVRERDGQVRVQTFRTDDGRQIEKRIRTEDDGDKVIVTRTQGRDGRTVERRRVIDRAGDDEVERRTINYGEWRDRDERNWRDRDGRDRDGRRGDNGRDRDWRDRDGRRGDWRDRDRDRERDVRIIIRAPRGLQIPLERYVVGGYAPREVLYETLSAAPVQRVERRYSVQDVTQSERLRSMVRRIDLDTITFDFNEARIEDSQLGRLDSLAEAMRRVIDNNPDALFLLEGHTDAVGSEVYNLELSEARALSVKYALMDAFGIPEDNLVTEGYGEEFLKVDTLQAERLNRRVGVRRIDDLVARR